MNTFDREQMDKIVDNLLIGLPSTPCSARNGLWSSHGAILCQTEQIAEALATALEAILGTEIVSTSYYDPAEDARDGVCDDFTGWYCIDFV